MSELDTIAPGKMIDNIKVNKDGEQQESSEATFKKYIIQL